MLHKFVLSTIKGKNFLPLTNIFEWKGQLRLGYDDLPIRHLLVTMERALFYDKDFRGQDRSSLFKRSSSKITWVTNWVATVGPSSESEPIHLQTNLTVKLTTSCFNDPLFSSCTDFN